MKKQSRAFLVAVSIGLTGIHGGCGSATEADHIASAKAMLAKNDLKAATIELKNVLDVNPSSTEGRYLMGKVMLGIGNPVAAEVELRKAKELAGDVNRWAPLLGQAMLQQFQFKKLVDELGDLQLTDPGAQTDLDVAVAAALSGLGQRDRAMALVESALARSPGHVSTQLLNAKLLARPGSIVQAIALVDKVLEAEPGNVEGWQTLGDLQLYGRSDAVKAGQAYTKALGLKADSVAANAAMVLVHLIGNDLPAARKQLNVMAKAMPNHPQTKFLEAKVLFLEGNVTRSREIVQHLLRTLPNHVPVLELAGAIELKLNALQQAEAYLNKALSKSPDQPAVRRLLADVMLRSGKPARALEVLAPNLESGRVDPLSLSQAAEALMQTGNFKRAEEFFRIAAKSAPNDPKYRISIALTQLAKGQSEAAFAELRAIAGSTPDTLPDLTLINVLMRRQQYDAAFQAIDSLQRKQPDKPLAASLRGRAQLALRDLTGARRSFERSLEKDPVFFPAITNLALIDQAEGKPEKAAARYEAVLKNDPRNTQAMMALAQIKSWGGVDKEAVGPLLEIAVQSSPTDPAPRVMLIHHWLSLHNLKSALATAQAGVAAMPDSPDMLDALGSIQMVAGEINQSISTFNRILAKYPNSIKTHLRLADAHIQANDPVSSERSFKRVLDLAPELIDAQRGLIALSVRAKQPARAIAVARDIQKQRPKESVGYLLEGDIHAHFKSWDAAIKAYRAGIDKSNPARAAELLYAATVAGKGKAEALRFVAEWMTRHPNDSQFLVFLGNNAVNTNELKEAVKFYGDAVAVNPKHPSALNNLAWVKAKLGQSGAVEMAERAVLLAPEDPAMLDTLAFALASENQIAKAVETAKLVLVKAPHESVYRLNLAKIYIQAGKKELAKNELQQLVKLGPKFQRQAEVSALLKSIL